MSVFTRFSVPVIFLVFSSIQAASTSTNAVYDSGGWTGVTIGTPDANQTNTFNATLGTKALTYGEE